MAEFTLGRIKIVDQNNNGYFDEGVDSLFDIYSAHDDEELEVDAGQVKKMLKSLGVPSLHGIKLPYLNRYESYLSSLTNVALPCSAEDLSLSEREKRIEEVKSSAVLVGVNISETFINDHLEDMRDEKKEECENLAEKEIPASMRRLEEAAHDGNYSRSIDLIRIIRRMSQRSGLSFDEDKVRVLFHTACQNHIQITLRNVSWEMSDSKKIDIWDARRIGASLQELRELSAKYKIPLDIASVNKLLTNAYTLVYNASVAKFEKEYEGKTPGEMKSVIDVLRECSAIPGVVANSNQVDALVKKMYTYAAQKELSRAQRAAQELKLDNAEENLKIMRQYVQEGQLDLDVAALERTVYTFAFEANAEIAIAYASKGNYSSMLDRFGDFRQLLKRKQIFDQTTTEELFYKAYRKAADAIWVLAEQTDSYDTADNALKEVKSIGNFVGFPFDEQRAKPILQKLLPEKIESMFSHAAKVAADCTYMWDENVVKDYFQEAREFSLENKVYFSEKRVKTIEGQARKTVLVCLWEKAESAAGSGGARVTELNDALKKARAYAKKIGVQFDYERAQELTQMVVEQYMENTFQSAESHAKNGYEFREELDDAKKFSRAHKVPFDYARARHVVALEGQYRINDMLEHARKLKKHGFEKEAEKIVQDAKKVAHEYGIKKDFSLDEK